MNIEARKQHCKNCAYAKTLHTYKNRQTLTGLNSCFKPWFCTNSVLFSFLLQEIFFAEGYMVSNGEVVRFVI